MKAVVCPCYIRISTAVAGNWQIASVNVSPAVTELLDQNVFIFRSHLHHSTSNEA